MLQHLHIQNYALISRLDMDFEGGSSVLTGETGAGKSILIGGINAILGGRVSKDIILYSASNRVKQMKRLRIK